MLCTSRPAHGGSIARLAQAIISGIARFHKWSVASETPSSFESARTFSPATRRAYGSPAELRWVSLGHDYLLVAHDPTLTTPVAQTGSMALSSPNGIRTRVATLRDRAGTSSNCAPIPSCLVRGPRASRVGASVHRNRLNGWAIGWTVGSRNPYRPTDPVLANPPPSLCSGFAPFCRSENPVRRRPGDASPASGPRRAR